MTIAIDFGTSNTVMTRWDSTTQQPEIIRLPGLSQQIADNPPLIPSLLYVADAQQEEVMVGQQVCDRGLDLKADPRFFRSFKRGIGTEIQGFLPELDGKSITFEQVGEWFLNRLLTQLNPETEDALILTVPVDSFEAYRHWLTGVCQSLNIEQVRILDEPTAAALGYGTTDQDLLLVVDFGGGTIDLSLVQLNLGEGKAKPMGFILKWGEKMLGESSSQKAKTARVIAKAGKNLGGSDLDSWLVDYFAQTQGVPKTSLITRLAEKVKIQLSTQEEGKEVYFNDETLESYTLQLDRATFKEILVEQDFLGQLDDLMTQVLQRGRLQGIEAKDINGVLLVGGTTQLPAVKEWVQKYFEGDKIRGEQPFTAIASGALQLAQGFQLKDFLYHSYGIRYWNRREKCHSWHPIIKAGMAYPMSEPVELRLGASVENQPSIELIIGELGSENSRTEVYFEGDRLITRTLGGDTEVKPLNDSDTAKTIAVLSPPGNPGSDRIRVEFTVNERCSLCITVEDLLTDRLLLDNTPVVQLS